MAINKISGNILADNLVRGANLAFQGNLLYVDVDNQRIGVNTIGPSTALEVVGTLTVGNVSIPDVGNVDVGNVNIVNLLDPVANSDAATKFYVDSNSANVLANLGNISIANTTIAPFIANGNITLAPTDQYPVYIDTTSGLVIPVGNTAQRFSPPSTGMLRFNTDIGRAEIYDGTEWDSVTGNVTAQVLNGDNSTSVFTLDRNSTAAATLVAINGVVQLPAVAYSITGNQITFTQAPAVSDVIDIRFL